MVSCADATVTLLGLVGAAHLPHEVVEAVRAIDYVERLAQDQPGPLRAARASRRSPGHAAGPQHRGTIHVCPALDYIERAFDDARAGRPSASPVLECTIPSVVDPARRAARPSRHADLRPVRALPARRGKLGRREGGLRRPLRRPARGGRPRLPRRSVLHREVLSPLDIERRFGLTGGNIFQGAMGLSQLFFMRPIPGYADYRTPVRDLYLCGAATHPGGGVMGACGYNAAREILRDARRGG